MNKGDLIAQVAETAGLTKSQASDAVNGLYSMQSRLLLKQETKLLLLDLVHSQLT